MNNIPKKKIVNYVDNSKLLVSFLEWYDKKKIAEEQGKPEPEPPRYISECIILIPTRLASKGNFAGYSFRDDMIGDAVENLVQYYRNFDPEKSKNPFAYFTQISYYAFLRRILKEKKQSYVKHKLLQNSEILDSIITQDHDNEDYRISIVETLQNNLKPELEKYFEMKKTPKELKGKKTIEDLLIEEVKEIEEIMGDDVDALQVVSLDDIPLEMKQSEEYNE
jgi:hypothetical protein